MVKGGNKLYYYFLWDNTDKKYKMRTDDLVYGDGIEIIWDVKNNCYRVKDLQKLRKNGKKVNPDDLDFSSDFMGM